MTRFSPTNRDRVPNFSCGISVIIVHHHTEELLGRCLDHLREIRDMTRFSLTNRDRVPNFPRFSFTNRDRVPNFQTPHEVFVIDNGSDPAKLQQTKDRFPEDPIVWITNPTNEGFARAVNQGLTLARGKYCLLLNPDCFVGPDTIGQLLKRMEENPTVGLAGGRHRFEDGRLQPTCRTFPTPWDIFTDQFFLNRLFPHSPLFNRYKMGGFRHDQMREVDQLVGSCLMIRRAVLDQIDLMDEQFFLYFEEVDLCRRAKAAGWKIVFFPDPEMEVTHIGGASSSQTLPLRTLHRYRSLCLWCRKYFSQRQATAVKAIALAGLILRIIGYGVSDNKDQRRAHWKALKQWPQW